jgi:DNA-binding NtrC family response regulator
LQEGINFLPKPYQPRTLVQMVRNCLDEAKREQASARASDASADLRRSANQ